MYYKQLKEPSENAVLETQDLLAACEKAVEYLTQSSPQPRQEVLDALVTAIFKTKKAAQK